jgi:hypothetical protein
MERMIDPFFVVITFCKLEVFKEILYFHLLEESSPSTKTFCVFENLLYHIEKT